MFAFWVVVYQRFNCNKMDKQSVDDKLNWYDLQIKGCVAEQSKLWSSNPKAPSLLTEAVSCYSWILITILCPLLNIKAFVILKHFINIFLSKREGSIFFKILNKFKY